MSKGSIIVRLVVWTVAAVLLISVLAGALLFDGFTFSIGSIRYENAVNYTSGDLDTADFDSIRKIEINWEKGSVKIAPSKNGRLTLTEEGATGIDDSMYWLVEDGTLTVQFAKSGYGLFRSRPSKGLTVSLPEKLIEKLEELRFDAVSADCEITDVSSKKIQMDSVSANVTARGIKCDAISVDTVSGDVNIAGKIGDFECDSVSGKVTLETQKAPRRIGCDSISGDLTLIFGECEGFTFTSDSVSGSFSSDFPATERDGKRIYGDGSTLIEVDSVSGSVRIMKLNSPAAS